MNRCSRIHLICLFISVSFVTQHAVADSCNDTIRRNNIVGNALFTLMFRAFNGELHSWRDAGESLAFGATNGYLFYQSRKQLGKGNESRGLALAYLAASSNENVSLGLHPLTKMRYGIGPVEINWLTPFSGEANSTFSLSLNTIDALTLTSMAIQGSADSFELRNGVVTGRDNGVVPGDYSAIASGRSVITKEQFNHDQALWHHELIHTTQYLQFSSFGSTNFDLMRFDRLPGSDHLQGNRSVGGMDLSFRVEWFHSLMQWVDSQQNYEDRWFEIEAARLGQHTSPLHNDSDLCSAQLGFEFKF